MQSTETIAWWEEGFERGIQISVDAEQGSNHMERVSQQLKSDVRPHRRSTPGFHS